MEDVQEQLAMLRQRIASIDRKYATASASAPAATPKAAEGGADGEMWPHRPSRYFIEEIMSGAVIKTGLGEHFETERLYEGHRCHGSMYLSDLAELPPDLLSALSEGAIADATANRWAFLDTETTGLAGGAGTYAFLIGVGSIEAGGFRLRQFFMRDYGEEASLLSSLSEYLSRFDVLITYNGKKYDQPLLETRYRMARARLPFGQMEHLDLLFGARRLWKLRLDTCRLVELESRILGVERQGDLPGEMIPYYYFDYLRSRQAMRLVPIFHHNAIDIVSLACLTAVVTAAFQAPEQAGLRHGADLIGLARWLMQAGRPEDAVRLFRRAVDLGLPDDLLFKTLWETAIAEKRLGRNEAALAVFTDLAASRNPYRVRAYEELAKHYEHRERNYLLALEMTRCAAALPEIAADAESSLCKRAERLKRRTAGK